jgi:GNAT superfamily N-acetyltransferase
VSLPVAVFGATLDHAGMEISAKPVRVQAILPWRELYRQEMDCQIVHDSLHSREGWTQPYLLTPGGTVAGYGSILVGGPWTGKRTAFEFYVVPEQRSRVFDLFRSFLTTSGATTIQAQTNDALLSVMLHTWGCSITSEKIVFEDKLTAVHAPVGVTFRRVNRDDAARTVKNLREPDGEWALEVDGAIVATGGILFHYNRPYADIYMEVAEPFRRRGLGSYLVQELKKVCYELGSVPCARCDTTNIASRKTLQKAGFVPCAHILSGTVSMD